MFTVYILLSKKTGRHYIGHAESMDDRLARHNRGAVRSTKHGVPWRIVYKEIYSTRAEAYRREQKIESYKSGILFKKILGLWKDKPSHHGEVA